jgi:hypothetical protein
LKQCYCVPIFQGSFLIPLLVQDNLSPKIGLQVLLKKIMPSYAACQLNRWKQYSCSKPLPTMLSQTRTRRQILDVARSNSAIRQIKIHQYFYSHRLRSIRQIYM